MSPHPPTASRRLVAETDVRATPRGGRLDIPQDALVTPLARQVALERNITLRERRTAPALQRTDIRGEIVRVGQLLHQKGFIVASDGNISVRLGADRVLATPSGRHKGFLRPDELITTDMDGRPINPPPGLEPTSEMPMHLEIYRQRPQVAAVVHAHLPLAVALSIAGIRLDEPFLPEAVITLGPIPTTEYAIPSSLENVTAIRDLIGQHDAIVLRRHGAITVGSDPFDAYMRMEAVEHKAHIVLLLRLLGQGEPLSSGQVASLLELRRRLGLGPAT